MIFQNEIFFIALVGMGLVALGFIYMIVQAGKPPVTADGAQKHKRSVIVRRWLFGALLVIFIGTSYGTLKQFPEPPQHGPLDAAQIVNVVGHQWSWEMSTNQITAGVPIEFDVTSADVNHGFALYAPDGRIVVQTQAMPGYTNKILYTFDQPGTYMVRCLEYCGLAHHVMETQLSVVANAGGPTS
ncbi:MAG TPA: cytochrome oxidase [Gammaproteobacteria bacterium]|nr:cytochrome oxidase [Gammaproteobacteria bacterium]